MKFDWDEKKARINLLVHGISFSEAEEIFDDYSSIESLDPFNSDEEPCYRRIGLSSRRLLFLIFTVRYKPGEEIIRLISVRKATAKEEKFYNESNK